MVFKHVVSIYRVYDLSLLGSWEFLVCKLRKKRRDFINTPIKMYRPPSSHQGRTFLAPCLHQGCITLTSFSHKVCTRLPSVSRTTCGKWVGLFFDGFTQSGIVVPALKRRKSEGRAKKKREMTGKTHLLLIPTLFFWLFGGIWP